MKINTYIAVQSTSCKQNLFDGGCHSIIMKSGEIDVCWAEVIGKMAILNKK